MSNRIYWQISADVYNGEGNLTKKTMADINQLIKEEPLLAADILGDVLFEIENLYETSVRNIFPTLKRNITQ